MEIVFSPVIVSINGRDSMFRKQTRAVEKLDEMAEVTNVTLELTADLEKQGALITLTKQDLARLRCYRSKIEEVMPRLVDLFYDRLEQVEEMRHIIQQHSSSDRLKKTLAAHIAEMFEGKVDAAYIERRYRIAKRHHMIGLKGKWYMAAFQKIFDQITEQIESESYDGATKMNLVSAVSKIFSFEQQIVLEMFDEEASNMQEQIDYRERMSKTVQVTTEDLASMTQEMAANFNVMNDRVNMMLTVSDEAKQTLGMMRDSSQSGKEALFTETSNLKNISEELSESAQQMVKLDDLMTEISSIAQAVKRIADQTNLLSLNAAIEAARAGEQGKGFQVVAAEVRQLANQSKTSAEQVEDLTKRLNERISATSRRVTMTEQDMRGSMERMNHVSDLFVSIVTDSSQADGRMHSLADEIQEVSNAIVELQKATNQIATSSTQLMDTAQEL